MKALAPPSSPPIEIDDRGTWRVAGSRVTLDAVIVQFKEGATPEQIQDDFPSLTLSSIYGVISYYLANIEKVEAALRKLAEKARGLRKKSETKQVASMRSRLRAARDARAAKVSTR